MDDKNKTKIEGQDALIAEIELKGNEDIINSQLTIDGDNWGVLEQLGEGEAPGEAPDTDVSPTEWGE